MNRIFNTITHERDSHSYKENSALVPIIGKRHLMGQFFIRITSIILLSDDGCSNHRRNTNPEQNLSDQAAPILNSSTTIMSQTNPDFREELTWNSYFVDGFYKNTNQEVRRAADQFEEETGTTITDPEIEKIVEDIMDDGLKSLTADDSG